MVARSVVVVTGCKRLTVCLARRLPGGLCGVGRRFAFPEQRLLSLVGAHRANRYDLIRVKPYLPHLTRFVALRLS